MTGPFARSLRSPHNPQLKELRRALQRGEPTTGGLCAIEGRHLLEEALRSPVEVVRVFTKLPQPSLPAHIEQIEVPDHILAQVASTETSPGVVSLIRFPANRPAEEPRLPPLVVYLDGLQDPGNAGTIVRAAEAFGATEVRFGEGCVSPFNPKTLRASAGSLFRVPFQTGASALTGDLTWYWSAPRDGERADQVDWKRPCGLVVGSEARGVHSLRRQAARPVHIPTLGVESLNAAIAASLLLYEAARQRYFS